MSCTTLALRLRTSTQIVRLTTLSSGSLARGKKEPEPVQRVQDHNLHQDTGRAASISGLFGAGIRLHHVCRKVFHCSTCLAAAAVAVHTPDGSSLVFLSNFSDM